MRNVFCVLLLAVAIGSCKKENEKCAFIPDTSQSAVTIDFVSLEDSLPAITTKQQFVDFFSRHTELRDQFFSRPLYPNDSVFISKLFYRFSNPHFDTLLMETKKVFGNGDKLKKELSRAFSNLKYYYPDFIPPRVITAISGMETDLFISDSLMIIGLDFYLGRDSRFRPDMYDYLLRRFEKESLVPSIILLYGISEQFAVSDPDDRTLLAEMIAYGKAYAFTKRMLPCTPDSILIGYTAEEMEGAKFNEDLIWKRLVEDQALYATSHLVKQKFIGERPKTVEVGEKCPGRIGMWVGWQMVNQFAEENPGISFQEIMTTAEADKIFKGSRYRPEMK